MRDVTQGKELNEDEGRLKMCLGNEYKKVMFVGMMAWRVELQQHLFERSVIAFRNEGMCRVRCHGIVSLG